MWASIRARRRVRRASAEAPRSKSMGRLLSCRGPSPRKLTRTLDRAGPSGYRPRPVTDVPASVARVFDRALALDPDHEALVTRTRRLTYAELDRQADRAAHALRALGV